MLKRASRASIAHDFAQRGAAMSRPQRRQVAVRRSDAHSASIIVGCIVRATAPRSGSRAGDHRGQQEHLGRLHLQCAQHDQATAVVWKNGSACEDVAGLQVGVLHEARRW
jgi:hypothetical protein